MEKNAGVAVSLGAPKEVQELYGMMINSFLNFHILLSTGSIQNYNIYLVRLSFLSSIFMFLFILLRKKFVGKLCQVL